MLNNFISTIYNFLHSNIEKPIFYICKWLELHTSFSGLALALTLQQTNTICELLKLPETDYNKTFLGHSPLTRATAQGNLKLVKELMERGADLNKANKYGINSLHIAAFKGHLEIVEILLAHQDIQVNIAGKDGTTPLLLAVGEGNCEIVEKLLTHKDIQVNIAGKNGTTPLLLAVGNGDSEIVEKLLSSKDIQVNIATGDFGLTPLLIAVLKGNCEIVEKLLTHKDIQVNIAGEDGTTPLSVAVGKGNCEIIEKLLSRKDIQVNSADKNGTTPLLLAVGEGNFEIVEKLLSHKDIQVNSAYKDGTTPLLLAVGKGNFNIANKLLSRSDIQVNKDFNNNGITPLHIAIIQEENDTIIQLLNKGANILLSALKDDDSINIKIGDTPFSLLLSKGWFNEEYNYDKFNVHAKFQFLCALKQLEQEKKLPNIDNWDEKEIIKEIFLDIINTINKLDLNTHAGRQALEIKLNYIKQLSSQIGDKNLFASHELLGLLKVEIEDIVKKYIKIKIGKEVEIFTKDFLYNLNVCKTPKETNLNIENPLFKVLYKEPDMYKLVGYYVFQNLKEKEINDDHSPKLLATPKVIELKHLTDVTAELIELVGGNSCSHIDLHND